MRGDSENPSAGREDSSGVNKPSVEACQDSVEGCDSSVEGRQNSWGDPESPRGFSGSPLENSQFYVEKGHSRWLRSA